MITTHREDACYGRRQQDLPDTREIRDKVVAWIVQRDTVLMEMGLGANGIINAVLSVTTNGDGQPVAPFMFSALKFLNFDQTSWFWMMSIYAIVAIVALVHGQATGNALFLRASTHAVGSIFQAMIATSILTSPMAPAAGLKYGTTAFWSFVVALVLIIKYDVRRQVEAHRGTGQGEK